MPWFRVSSSSLVAFPMAKVRAAFFAFQSCLNVVAVCGAQIPFLASNEGSAERFKELSAQALPTNVSLALCIDLIIVLD